MEPKDGHDEEHQAFLDSESSLAPDAVSPRRTASRRGVWWYLRILIEAVMAISLVVQFFRPLPISCRRGQKTSPIPAFPRKEVTFVPQQKYLHDDMFWSEDATMRTLHNWVELSADARGYVQIANYKSYDLQDPYNITIAPHQDGPGYMISVFHQLHCLSYLVQKFQSGFGGANLTEEVAHHSVHCFDYLRQAIMCAGDTSLEGSTEAGPGWGSKHMCADYSAVLGWANEHGALVWRNGLIPDEGNIL